MKRKHYFHVFGPDVIEEESGDITFIEMNHGCFILTPYDYSPSLGALVKEESYWAYFTDQISDAIIEYSQSSGLRKVAIVINGIHYAEKGVKASMQRIELQLRIFGISLDIIPLISIRSPLRADPNPKITHHVEKLDKYFSSHNHDDTLYISNVLVPDEFDVLKNTAYNKSDILEYLSLQRGIKTPRPGIGAYDESSHYPNVVVKPIAGEQGDGVRFFKTDKKMEALSNKKVEEFVVPKRLTHVHGYSNRQFVSANLQKEQQVRATDLRIKIAAAEDGRTIPLFTYRKISPHSIVDVLPDGETNPELFLTNIIAGGSLALCNYEEQERLKEYGKKVMPMYLDYLESKEQKVHVAWTGGFDSTYVLMKFLLEGKEVQPIYLSKVDKRHSQENEEKTMENLLDMIKKDFPELGPKLHDVELVEVEQIEEIERKIQALGGHGTSYNFPIGTQTTQMAHFCSYFPNLLYFGIEAPLPGASLTRTAAYFSKYMTLDENQCGFVDTSKMRTKKDKLYKIYKNLRFPIWTMTKKDMYKDSKERGFNKILENTWSCWHPYRESNTGNGCGTCLACKGRATVL